MAVAAKVLAVGAEDDSVGALLLDADAVVGEAVLGVEVEDPEKAGALEDDDFVALVLQADVGLRRVQPAVLLFGPLHLAVEFVEESVAQEVVIDEVELAPCIVEAVVVARTWEVQPFRMAEFVAFKVEVALPSETVRD